MESARSLVDFFEKPNEKLKRPMRKAHPLLLLTCSSDYIKGRLQKFVELNERRRLLLAFDFGVAIRTFRNSSVPEISRLNTIWVIFRSTTIGWSTGFELMK